MEPYADTIDIAPTIDFPGEFNVDIWASTDV